MLIAYVVLSKHSNKALNIKCTTSTIYDGWKCIDVAFSKGTPI